MGITSRPEFDTVDLGPRHSERLRNMIAKEDPGEPHDYGCVFLATTKYRDITTDSIFKPDRGRFDNHISYLLNLRGIFWLFFVSSNTDQIPCPQVFLSKEGNLPLFWDDRHLPAYIQKFFSDLGKSIR
ncbi:MAG: hypothetical protein ABIH23_13190 [bacterium]